MYKEYIKSSLITFFTAFCLVLLTQWDSLDLQSFKDGAYIAILFAAFRAGIKSLIEMFIKNFSLPAIAKKTTKVKID